MNPFGPGGTKGSTWRVPHNYALSRLESPRQSYIGGDFPLYSNGGIVILRLPGSGHAEIIDFSGLYEDGWCEPVLRCTLRVLKDSTRCQLGVWLKPELERVAANFTISVNGRHSLQCRVPYDVSTVVQVACPAAAGTTVELDIACDNLVVDKGSDLRPLSFLLKSLVLS